MTDTPPNPPSSPSKAGALLQTGWRPYTGWVLLAVIVEQFALGPVFDWLSVNWLHLGTLPKVGMDGLMFLASVSGLLVVSRTVEKLNNAD